MLPNFFVVVLIFTLLLMYRSNKLHNAKFAQAIEETSLKYILFEKETSEAVLDATEVRKIIQSHNETILNQDIYENFKSSDPIIVIMVDKDVTYLKYLIMSLEHVRGIQDALVIFSHSYYDVNVNRLIEKIDFCRVMQIFYPYSLQAFPNEFPGYSSNDCPQFMKIRNAEKLDCHDASTPEIHGHYRNPALLEKKHHWWWTANRVFDNLTFAENHKGLVIFLEDEVYLLEDFLYMALYMNKAARKQNHCEFVCLGFDSGLQLTGNNTFEATVTTWDPKHHSLALAFDIVTWNSIVSQYDLFCDIDDYTWLRSLFYLSVYRRDAGVFRVISSLVPRAVKLTFNGIFRSVTDYFILEKIFRILDAQKSCVDDLFPPYLEIFTDIEMEQDEPIFDFADSKGDWSDPRDKELCSNVTMHKIRKVLMDTEIVFQRY